MPGIFMTYRRDDTSSQAGRVYDWLGEHYGEDAVFKDIDSIDPLPDPASASRSRAEG